jgi:hypothetical protein
MDMQKLLAENEKHIKEVLGWMYLGYATTNGKLTLAEVQVAYAIVYPPILNSTGIKIVWESMLLTIAQLN